MEIFITMAVRTSDPTSIKLRIFPILPIELCPSYRQYQLMNATEAENARRHSLTVQTVEA
jgi:hypothetical protein